MATIIARLRPMPRRERTGAAKHDARPFHAHRSDRRGAALGRIDRQSFAGERCGERRANLDHRRGVVAAVRLPVEQRDRK
jgi:hypothetical protein